jgi:hypothetical protein
MTGLLAPGGFRINAFRIFNFLTGTHTSNIIIKQIW